MYTETLTPNPRRAGGGAVTASTGTCYLICFERPLAHARHYIGYAAKDLERRIQEHRAGRGARLLQVLGEQGIGWRVVRTWPNADRKLERKLKNRHGPALCPVCLQQISLPLS